MIPVPLRQLAIGPLTCLLGCTTALAAPASETDAAHGRRAAPKPVETSEALIVLGAGASRELSTVTRGMMARAVPGTSPLKVLAELPGVNYQSADPFGIYEYSSSLYVRGFFQSQLGFTLDDVPLGDQQFNNYNGLSITRALSSENIRSTTVSQGAGAIDVASSSNLGGAVQFTSIDPDHRRGATVAQTFGSNATYRTFLRLQSGDLNATGTRFWVSYAHTTTDLWKGHGSDRGDQVNFALLQPLRGDSSLRIAFDWSEIAQFDYQDMSLDYLDTYGPKLANYYPDYATAYRAAQGRFTPAIARTGDPLDAAYYSGTANRTDLLAHLTWDQALTDRLRWKTTLYGHGDSGYSTWATPYTPSPNGAPLSVRTQDPGITRGGGLTALQWDLHPHTLTTGLWYEHGQFTESRTFAQAPLLGQGSLGDLTDAYPAGVFATPWREVFDTNTFQFHLQDNWRITPTLRVDAGFRSLVVHTANDVPVQDPAYNRGARIAQGGLTASNAFLPQVSANWRFAPHHELFADVSHNMRAYPQDGFGTNVSATPWTATQAAFLATKDALRPETDWVYEGGYRFTSRRIGLLLAGYHVDFSNRLQLISTGPVISPTTAVVNVGGVTSNGAEASLMVQPLDGLRLYNSLSYNHTTYDNDVVTSSGAEPTRGKRIPNYPQYMYKGSIVWSHDGLSLHADGQYLSSRPLSYLNDTRINPYFIANLGASYAFGAHGPFRGITAAINVYNLLDRTYVSTMGELGNPFSGDYQGFMIGAPRQVFGTISAEF